VSHRARGRRRGEGGGAAPEAAPLLSLSLFGGLDARLSDGSQVRFESRRTRALLAYLALQRGQPVLRDHLSALLWPGSEPDVARRNLRQAVYSLRNGLGTARRILRSPVQEIFLDADLAEVDGVTFERLANRGLQGRGPAAIEALSEALERYRGELLEGLALRGVEPFEEWRAQERERLRELAVACARDALRRCEADGLHESALRFAQRLGELDPLSEESCRSSMRLLSRLGRRARALEHYGRFVERLDRELDVPPEPALEKLRLAIAENLEIPEDARDRPGPIGPVVPLVGRDRAWRELTSIWSEVRAGDSRLTVVEGARGLGKSRMVRTFLYRALAGGKGTVLLARGAAAEAKGVRGILVEATESLPFDAGALDSPLLRSALGRIIAALPEVRPRRRDLPGPSKGRRPDPLTAFSDLLRESAGARVSGTERKGAPVVLFVDDLERSPGVVDGLIELVRRVRGHPVWILAALRPEELSTLDAARYRDRLRKADARSVELGPLDRAAVLAAARSLVGDRDAEALSEELERAAAGSPLGLAESVNLLADRGWLRLDEEGDWVFGFEGGASGAIPVGADALIDERISLLPNTSRRLLGLAAVIGDRFDTATLLEVDREHPAVLEAAMQILIERWMVRPRLGSWTAHRRDRDLTIWQTGGRHGPFEFAHRTVRDRLATSIDRDRRSFLEQEIESARRRLEERGAS